MNEFGKKRRNAYRFFKKKYFPFFIEILDIQFLKKALSSLIISKIKKYRYLKAAYIFLHRKLFPAIICRLSSARPVTSDIYGVIGDPRLLSACIGASFSRGFCRYSQLSHSIQLFDYRKIITAPYITCLTRCNEINPFTKENDWADFIITSEEEKEILIIIQNSILFFRLSSNPKKMTGILNELMPAILPSRMTVKFQLLLRHKRMSIDNKRRGDCESRVCSQVLTDGTNCSLKNTAYH